VRGCPQADNPAHQGSKAGGDIQFAALGTCFVGSVFVELAQALAEGVLRLSEQERGVGGDGGQSAGSCVDDGEAPEGEGEGLWFGEVWEVGVEGAVKLP
jgi:hypothetical protein